MVVRGVNDIGSAVAHRLFRAGCAVVIHDGPRPTATRRGMAFADAVFDGRAELAGVVGVRVDDLEALTDVLAKRDAIAVVVADFAAVIERVRPDVLVDARMRKRARPEAQRDLARLTIGLGPNFVAGETTDLVVETGWGDDLGKVVDRGATRPLAGEPRQIGGHARERYVYAPAEGIFRTDCQIGDPVAVGQVVARIGPTELVAPLDGVLRGLTRDGVPVATRTKVIEVDPRGPKAVVTGLGQRPGRIADGVLGAVSAWALGGR